MSEQELKALRVRIDSLDEKVLELISERARCAQEVARVKMASLAEGEVPVFYRPEREAQVLKRVMERNKGPLGNEEMARLSSQFTIRGPEFPRRSWPGSFIPSTVWTPPETEKAAARGSGSPSQNGQFAAMAER